MWLSPAVDQPGFEPVARPPGLCPGDGLVCESSPACPVQLPGPQSSCPCGHLCFPVLALVLLYCDSVDKSPGKAGARFFAVWTAPGTVHLNIGLVSSSLPACSPYAASPGALGAGTYTGGSSFSTRGEAGLRRHDVLPHVSPGLGQNCFWNEHTWRLTAAGRRGGS